MISKNKVFTEIETDFLAKIGNSNAILAQIQVISKKKRSSPKSKRIFRPKTVIQTLFQAESRHLLHNFSTQFPLGGGCFHFFTKNRPQKHQKRAILNTLQANRRGSSPPGYATGRNHSEMGPVNSLHASIYYNEYNERFDLIFCYRI